MTSTRIGASCVAFAAIASLGGCTIARENVLASVNSVIGLSLTQDDKSQLYEAEIGYGRRQAFSIPTGKTITTDKDGNEVAADTNPSDVPDVVAALRIDSGIEHLFIGMNVKELFATGKNGVSSGAAVAMFISEGEGSTSPEVAEAASAAAVARTPAEVKNLPQVRELQDRVKALDPVKHGKSILTLNQSPPTDHPNSATEARYRKATEVVDAKKHLNARLGAVPRGDGVLEKWDAAITKIESE